MPIIMYSIYVGHYDSPAKTKIDVAKLNALGLKAFTFSRGDHYALKVFASANQEKAFMTKAALERKGFFTELEQQVINPNKN